MCSLAYIGFGANLGDPEDTFFKAMEKIGALKRVYLRKVSSLYRTEPVGLKDNGPEFLNAVLEAQVEMSPFDLIYDLRKIEKALGKNRSHKSDRSRKIDLDLLLFADKVFSSDTLEVPHPRMESRGFVLAPLAEIAPDFVHPGLKLTISELLDNLDPEELRKVRLFKAVNRLEGV